MKKKHKMVLEEKTCKKCGDKFLELPEVESVCLKCREDSFEEKTCPKCGIDWIATPDSKPKCPECRYDEMGLNVEREVRIE